MKYKYYKLGSTLLRLRDGKYWDYYKTYGAPRFHTWWSCPDGYVDQYSEFFKEIPDADAMKELFLRQL